MPANTSPIFTLVPNVVGVPIGGAGTTKSDGTGTIGTDMFLGFTAGVNGSLVQEVRLSPTASVAATPTTATVHRVYVSTKASGATLPADTHLIAEVSAPAQTADHATIATVPLVIPINRQLAPNQTILISSHVANAANTGWQAVTTGGDF